MWPNNAQTHSGADDKLNAVEQQQCNCFVCHNMSSLRRDVHGQKCLKKTDRERQTLWITDHKHDSELSKSFSWSLSPSFFLRLLSLSPHTMAQATTLSTAAAFVLPHKEIFSPGCLRRCCYGLQRVVQSEQLLFSTPLGPKLCATGEWQQFRWVTKDPWDERLIVCVNVKNWWEFCPWW